MSRPRRRAEDREDLPSIIPEVIRSKNGEPIIAREQVVQPSPVPRVLTIVLLLLAAFSVGYTVFQQEQRSNDRAETRAEYALVVAELQRTVEEVDRDRERLRALVLALAEAETPEERSALLRAFAVAEDRQAVKDAP